MKLKKKNLKEIKEVVETKIKKKPWRSRLVKWLVPRTRHRWSDPRGAPWAVSLTLPLFIWNQNLKLQSNSIIPLRNEKNNTKLHLFIIPGIWHEKYALQHHSKSEVEGKERVVVRWRDYQTIDNVSSSQWFQPEEAAKLTCWHGYPINY